MLARLASLRSKVAGSVDTEGVARGLALPWAIIFRAYGPAEGFRMVIDGHNTGGRGWARGKGKPRPYRNVSICVNSS